MSHIYAGFHIIFQLLFLPTSYDFMNPIFTSSLILQFFHFHYYNAELIIFILPNFFLLLILAQIMYSSYLPIRLLAYYLTLSI